VRVCGSCANPKKNVATTATRSGNQVMGVWGFRGGGGIVVSELVEKFGGSGLQEVEQHWQDFSEKKQRRSQAYKLCTCLNLWKKDS